MGLDSKLEPDADLMLLSMLHCEYCTLGDKYWFLDPVKAKYFNLKIWKNLKKKKGQ